MSIEPRFYQIEKDGPVILWKYANPPRNLLTIDAMEELRLLVEEFDKDAALRVGVVTSAVPGMFIQHFDVSLIIGWAEAMSTATDKEIAQQLELLPKPLGIGDCTSKPVICAINGPVEGGGCELALGCDLRFISRDSFMGQPEVIAGIIPGGGGTQRLARLVGISKAMELCLTGRRIYPDEAERLGLVVQACDPNELMPTVMKFARELSQKPPFAVKNIKRAIKEGVNQNIEEGLILERKLFFEAIRSEEALKIMRLYVASGQDRQKLAELLAKEEEEGAK